MQRHLAHASIGAGSGAEHQHLAALLDDLFGLFQQVAVELVAHLVSCGLGQVGVIVLGEFQLFRLPPGLFGHGLNDGLLGLFPLVGNVLTSLFLGSVNPGCLVGGNLFLAGGPLFSGLFCGLGLVVGMRLNAAQLEVVEAAASATDDARGAVRVGLN